MQAGNRLDAEGRFTDQPTRDLVAALLTAFKALAGLSLQYSLSQTWSKVPAAASCICRCGRKHRLDVGVVHTVATGVAGEPTAPGNRSGGAVRRKR